MRHSTTRRVYIHDTDASGLVFYGSVLRWLSEAEAELFESLGHRSPTSEGVGAPIRSVNVEYLRPLRIHDKCQHAVWVGRCGVSSFSVCHELTHDGELAVAAFVRHVTVSLATMTPVSAPEAVRRAAQAGDTRHGDPVQNGTPAEALASPPTAR